MEKLHSIQPSNLPHLVVVGIVTFLLFGVVPRYFWYLKYEVVSPLAEDLLLQSSAEVLTATNPTSTLSPSLSPIATFYPSIAPTASPRPRPSASPRSRASPVSINQLEDWLTKYANFQSVSRELLKKIAVCESKLNSQAVNGDYAGLYQFASGTWITTRSRMNLNTDVNLRFNAEEAIKTAAFRIATQGPSAWPNCAK